MAGDQNRKRSRSSSNDIGAQLDSGNLEGALPDPQQHQPPLSRRRGQTTQARVGRANGPGGLGSLISLVVETVASVFGRGGGGGTGREGFQHSQR